MERASVREIWNDTKYEWRHGGKGAIIFGVCLLLFLPAVGIATALMVAALPQDEQFPTVVIGLLLYIAFSTGRRK